MDGGDIEEVIIAEPMPESEPIPEEVPVSAPAEPEKVPA